MKEVLEAKNGCDTFVSIVAFLLQINAEFQRTTTVILEPKFMSALDRHTPKLLMLFRAKGGALGRRLENIMEPLQDSVHSSIERTREVVLRCLIEYLGEQGGHLIKEFNDTEQLGGT
ncbi:uncharacterized protein LOC125245863 isoform X1 [Megalobrama amblycephala]|uniref:uncharacterized protein LOC125245863 isoform X1 n=1 Tax=Megalobrama amblycephala TaxID=75352 RepID=UPI002014614E|nr:uncharacterized protein LOC125245863 isoform X1 [Megalobrama amblycephala]